MLEPIDPEPRIFTVDKRWGSYVLKVQVWSRSYGEWGEIRDVTALDLPMFFAQLKDNVRITFK